MRYMFVMMIMLAMSACSIGLDSVSTDAGTTEIELGDRLGDSYFEGNFGDMPDIEGYADTVNVDVDNGEYFSAHSFVPNGDREAMTILSTYQGSFNSPDFVPGETLVFDYLRGNDKTDTLVFVVGCLFNDTTVGPYYDDHADQVEVFTEIVNSNVKRVNYTARWFDTEGIVMEELRGFINIEIQ